MLESVLLRVNICHSLTLTLTIIKSLTRDTMNKPFTIIIKLYIFTQNYLKL